MWRRKWLNPIVLLLPAPLPSSLPPLRLLGDADLVEERIASSCRPLKELFSAGRQFKLRADEGTTTLRPLPERRLLDQGDTGEATGNRIQVNS